MKPYLPASARSSQRGVTLVFALISLVILLIGAAAMVRSMSVSMQNAGNYGFKRDLGNQGERAVNLVLSQVNAGVLGTDAARQQSNAALNYSATVLPSNPQGIPLALLSDDFAGGAGTASNDIAQTDMGVTIRYVVDRMSTTAGPVDASTAILSEAPPLGGSELNPVENSSSPGGGGTQAGAAPRKVVYRLSIRVSGPRNTQSFFQATFTI